MGKVSRSFSIDEDLDRLLGERDDFNPSGAVNTFLQEVLASGQGTEAAMAVQLEIVEDAITELEGELRKKREERDRLRAALDERKEERRDVFESFAALRGVDASPSNAAVQRHAEKLGMAPETFLAKYREWSG